MIAQSAVNAGANALLTAFVVLGVVGSIWTMAKHPKAAFSGLMVVLGALWVGWQARGWPGVKPSEGIVLGIWHTWLGSLRIVWDTIYSAIGLDSVAERLGLAGN